MRLFIALLIGAYLMVNVDNTARAATVCTSWARMDYGEDAFEKQFTFKNCHDEMGKQLEAAKIKVDRYETRLMMSFNNGSYVVASCFDDTLISFTAHHSGDGSCKLLNHVRSKLRLQK